MLFCCVAFGQPKPDETFLNLPDSVVRQELSGLDKLLEIPLRSGDSNIVSFSRGSTYISIYLKRVGGTGANSGSLQLDSIFFVSHSHYWVDFPREAYSGINDLIPCDAGKPRKKSTYSNPYYKVYQSADKRRIYITMVAGKPAERYRVVWVVKDSRYLARSVDPITAP